MAGRIARTVPYLCHEIVSWHLRRVPSISSVSYDALMSKTKAGMTEHLSLEVLWDYRETVHSLSTEDLLHLANCKRCLASLAVAYMSPSRDDFEERIRKQSAL
jgi:hypothetical protein